MQGSSVHHANGHGNARLRREGADDENSGAGNAQPEATPSDRVTDTATTAGVRLEVNNEVATLSLADLDVESDDQVIVQHLDRAEAPAIVRLGDLIDLPDQTRWSLLLQLRDLGDKVRYRVGDDEVVEQLFDGARDLLVGDDDSRRCGSAKRFALEVAAITHTTALSEACSSIQKKLRKLGVNGVVHRELLDAAKKLAKLLVGTTESATTDSRLASVLAGAPLPEGLVSPKCWLVSADGIARIGGEDGPRLIVPAPVLIVGRLRAVNDNQELLRMAYFRDDRWHTVTIERSIIASRQRIVDLADFGIGVNSNNAGDLVAFLADFEAANIKALPLATYVNQLGWVDDGLDAFVWGCTLITENGRYDVPDESSDALPDQPIVFRGADDGDEQLAAGFHAAGSLEDWLSNMERIAKFPSMRLAVIEALTPPVLPILNVPNYCDDSWGETSAGKTTRLRVGASVWGNPNEGTDKSIVRTWECTPVFIERAASLMQGLPLFIDETKKAKNPDDVSRAIYDIASGVSKGRGSRKGLARSSTFKTVLVTTGESPASSFSTAASGSKARCIELWGSPFGKTGQKFAKLAEEVTASAFASYGHAGPQFVEFLLKNKNRWNEWRKLFRAYRQIYQQKASGNSVLLRLATQFAAISVTSIIAKQALEWPWPTQAPLDELWDDLVRGAKEADRPAAALKYVYDWAVAHAADFYGRGSTQHPPIQGWAGRWDRSHKKPGGTLSWDFVAFVQNRLHEILEKGGFEPIPTVRGWDDRGWLVTTIENRDKPIRRRHHKVQVGEETVWAVAISRAAIQQLDDQEDQE